MTISKKNLTNNLKELIFTSVLFFITFSFDGIDVSTILTYLLIPFIRFKKISFYFLRSKVYLFTILFLFFSVISLIINEIELNQSVRFLSVTIFFLFISTNYIIDREFFISKFRVIIFGAVLQNLLALVLVYFFNIYYLEFFKPLISGVRFQGFYNLTILSLFNSILVIIIIYAPGLFVNKFNKIFAIVILTSTVVLSLTRSSWIVLIFGILISMILTNKNLIFYFAKRILIIGILLIVSLSVFKKSIEENKYTLLIIERVIDDTFKTKDINQEERRVLHYPIKLISSSQISFFGTGLGHSEKLGGKIFPNLYEFETKLGAHNTFIHILLDFGLFPFTFLIVSLLFVVIFFIENLKKLKKNNLIYIFIGFISLFPSAMFQDLIIYLPVSFFPIICITYIANTKSRLI